jgi:hypothetical protein
MILHLNRRIINFDILRPFLVRWKLQLLYLHLHLSYHIQQLISLPSKIAQLVQKLLFAFIPSSWALDHLWSFIHGVTAIPLWTFGEIGLLCDVGSIWFNGFRLQILKDDLLTWFNFNFRFIHIFLLYFV